MKCRHANIIIQETVRAHIDHVFEDGKYKLSHHSIGVEFAMFWVRCVDCGLDKDYSKYHLPKWLEKKWVEM